jgi:hypothetical protein
LEIREAVEGRTLRQIVGALDVARKDYAKLSAEIDLLETAKELKECELGPGHA